MPTLLELRERGHDIHVRTLAAELDALRALGLQAEAIAAEIEAVPLRDFEASSPAEGVAKALETFAARAAHEVPDLQRAIEDVGPDALLVDIMTVGASVVAEAGALPWAQWLPLFQRFSPDPSIPSWVTRVPFGIAPEPGLTVMNGPRAAVGLTPLTDPDEMWRAPLHLYYTARPFELDLAFPPSFEFVGPGVWEPAVPDPDWLAELDAPLILVSVSSEFQHDAALIQAALDAFSEHDVVVAASSAAHDPAGFDPPPNVHLERWLPHGQLLTKAACTICHGGMGIVQKTLAAGVPACVVPFGRDQFEVAARVAAVGAGTCLAPDALSADALRAAVHEAIGMRTGARGIADAFAGTGGASAAASALEAQVARVGTGTGLR